MLLHRIISLFAAVFLATSVATAAYGDIVINEIFPDPSPAVGLPEEEFVEIFNATNTPINLAGWKFSDGTTTVTLASYTLNPGAFLILCSSSDTALLSPFGPTLGVGTLPSLNNTSDNLTLTDNLNNLTDVVSYTTALYQDAAKDDGGYTLERINPFISCSGLNNWRASNAAAGGTPGTQNSIFSTDTGNFIPEVVSVTVVAGNIVVQYNNVMDTVNVAAAYSLSGGTIASVLFGPQPTSDTIVLTAPLDPGTVYNLTISGRSNCAGLSVDTTVQIALGVEGEFLDVIFTEIMADPTPVVGLPDAEWIEIYNRSVSPIDLTGWDLADGSGSITLGNITILPGQYLVLTSTSAAPLFSSSNVIAVAGFPSLTNTGEPLTLYNSSGDLIHHIEYTDQWHVSEEKKEGGWSLEMLDNENPCTENGNWHGSNDPRGGTPGEGTSLIGQLPDNTLPALVEVRIEDATHIVAVFSEKLNPSSLGSAIFSANNGLGVLNTFEIIEPGINSVRITLDDPLTAGIVYTLQVQNITDCLGNEIGFQDTARFGLAQLAEPGDVVINEVLFNPKTGGVDFVEIYNASDKILSSSALLIAELDPITGEVLESADLSSTNRLIFPGEYLVLTENPGIVKQQYFTPAPEAFLSVDDMPNYPDDEGVVSLQRNSDQAVLDELHYFDDWHFKVLDDEDGVSLERINIDNPTQDQSNWHSAAQTVGFATPGYRNSSYLDPGASDDFSLSPEVFSPDQDGFEDFLAIQYSFDRPGNLINIYIFDSEGRRIRHLVKNETAAQTGFYTWDGLDEDGARARIGIYIIVMETTDIDGGKVKRMKDKCVLAAKWN